MTDRREPIKNTCPDIDAVISTIQQMVQQMKMFDDKDDKDVILEYISDWTVDLSSIGIGHRCDIEDLRTANSTLREWGNGLVSDIEYVEEERDALAEQCEKLKEELSDAEDCIIRLNKEQDEK